MLNVFKYKTPNKPNKYPIYIGNQEFGFVSHLGVPGIMAQVEDEKTDLFSYCQALVPSPKVPNPQSRGLGLVLWATTHPTPPITFKHEGVLW